MPHSVCIYFPCSSHALFQRQFRLSREAQDRNKTSITRLSSLKLWLLVFRNHNHHETPSLLAGGRPGQARHGDISHLLDKRRVQLTRQSSACPLHITPLVPQGGRLVGYHRYVRRPWRHISFRGSGESTCLRPYVVSLVFIVVGHIAGGVIRDGGTNRILLGCPRARQKFTS